jgi:hypothetical protein
VPDIIQESNKPFGFPDLTKTLERACEAGVGIRAVERAYEDLWTLLKDKAGK